MENPPLFTNRLARETSPYLLQHAHNPVDWFPWGEEAFARARAEQKPIFLSVGYSTCHWCHVMERESFENEAIAARLNADFVSIKVDREERPDVDRVYMTFVQAANGSGGWPMNVFLTPELAPFSGGTYFPPTARGGSPGFPRVLEHLAKLWREERGKVIAHGAETLKMLRKYTSGSPAEADGKLDAGPLEVALAQLAHSFDEEWGGFGSSPKFPRPATLHFLLREHLRTGSAQAREMALVTLDKMAAGGMHDHLGGGFHRYSVDREWHVPHFEKMLYDQAQLALAYLEAFQLTRAPRYERVARGILDYVLRDLADRDGGFHSAEDADSLPERDAREKVEGAFYVWEARELEHVLGADLADKFGRHYAVEAEGNVASDPHGEFIGKNILIERAADEETAALLAEARGLLFAVRAQRPRPHLDDKVLTAWNALAISAFARAFQVLGEPRYLDAAQRAAQFLAAKMLRADDTVLRSFRGGVAAEIDGFADDYAFFIQALLDLYEADFDPRWLELAARLQRAMDARFADEHGGYLSTSGADASVLLRVKEDYDGAEPAPSSVAALNLQRLAVIFADAAWQTRAEQTLRAFHAQLTRLPQALPQMLVALDFALQTPMQIVIAGDPSAAATQAMLAAVHRFFHPRKILLLADGAASQSFLAERLPYLAQAAPVAGRAAAFLCENQTCQLPVTEPDQLEALLSSRRLQ